MHLFAQRVDAFPQNKLTTFQHATYEFSPKETSTRRACRGREAPALIDNILAHYVPFLNSVREKW